RGGLGYREPTGMRRWGSAARRPSYCASRRTQPMGRPARAEVRGRTTPDAPNNKPNDRKDRPMILDGKTVVVSGVGPGLGREIAAAAVREGATVAIGARTQANLEKAAAEIDPSGAKVAWEVTDITDAAQCARLAATATDRFGGVDALVNCAPLDAVFGGLEEADWDSWRQAIEINLFGTMQMTQAVIPAMKEHGGSVVFMGSQ